MSTRTHIGFRWLVGASVVCVSALVWADASSSLRQVIDQRIEAGWRAHKVKPVSTADDATFLRRVYLDLIGVIPTYDQATAFLDNKDAEKRSRLIDKLLDDPRFASHQADVWDLVFFSRHPRHPDARTRPGFKKWLGDQFAKNVPYDRWVNQMLRAQGNTVEQGVPMYLVQYQRKPTDAIESITQTFLGVQLQCARCHDHPYEKWTQVDFYGMAAFLHRLDVVEVGKKGKQKKLMIGEKPMGDILFAGPVAKQEPGKKGTPVRPKFLTGPALQEPAPPKDLKEVKFKSGKVPPKPYFSRLEKFADWMTASDNPFFAKAAANRVWAQFMGKGLVHPVDDMGKENEPSHPQLLDHLGQELVKRKFDLKWYIRELCNSRTYQLAADGETEYAFPVWYERARVRPLSAEELVGSWRIAMNFVEAQKEASKKLETEPFYPLTGGYVLRFFGESTDGEGYFLGGLQEHLYLNNGQLGKLITRKDGGLFHTVLKSEADWEKRVDRLFVSILSRRPEPQETERLVAYLKAEDRPDDRLAEAIWALMSCSEFRFNH